MGRQRRRALNTVIDAGFNIKIETDMIRASGNLNGFRWGFRNDADGIMDGKCEELWK